MSSYCCHACRVVVGELLLTWTQGLTRRHQSGHQLSLLLKDTTIAGEVIDESGMHSQLSDLIVENFAGADQVAGAGADRAQVLEGWEKRTGFKLRQSEPLEERVDVVLG